MKIISIKVTVRSAVLCMGTMDSCPVVPQANEPHANLIVFNFKRIIKVPLLSDMSMLSPTKYLSIFNIFLLEKA
jgi:hypothetical protein